MACPLMLKEIEESPAATNLRQIHSFIHLIPISIRPTKTHSPRKKTHFHQPTIKNIKIIQHYSTSKRSLPSSIVSISMHHFSYFLGGSSKIHQYPQSQQLRLETSKKDTASNSGSSESSGFEALPGNF